MSVTHSDTDEAKSDEEDLSDKELTEYKGDVVRIGYNDGWKIPQLTDQTLTEHQTAVCECGAHSANHGERHGKLNQYSGSLAHVYKTVMECHDCGNWWIAFV